MRLTDGAPEYKVKLQTTPPARHSLFPVLKDRPFANTIVLETPALPARFQAILDAKTQSTAERAGVSLTFDFYCRKKNVKSDAVFQ